MSWFGYAETVLRPMKERARRVDEERSRVVKTLRIAADRIAEEQPIDVVAWLRSEADKLEDHDQDTE